MRPLPLLLALTLVACGSSEPAPKEAPAPDAAPTEAAQSEAAPTEEPAAPGTKETPVTALPDFDAAWNFNDPAATRKAFEEMLAAHPDAPLPWRLELRTQIARTHSLARHFDEAHALLDAVDAELVAIDGHARVEIRSALERGRCHNSAGDKAAARPLFEQAWTAARGSGLDGLAVDAGHMVAIAAMGTDDELPWGRKALALAESSSQPRARKWRGSLYNNIGWSLHDRGDYQGALAMFDKQIVVRRETGEEPALRVSLWARARVLRSMKQHDEALAVLNAIVETYGDDATNDGFVHEELAENLLATGKDAEAKAAFALAHDKLKMSWVARAEPERIARLAELGGQ